jgi:hypothetical protein
VTAPRTYESSAPTTGLELHTVAKALLVAVGNYFAANGVNLPTRQYITTGDPAIVAWDCEQLTVCLANIEWGRSRDATQFSPTFGKAASINAMRHAIYAITLVRCCPTIDDTGTLPSAQALDDAGLASMLDAGLMSQALVNFVAFANPAIPVGCNIQAGSVQPLGPEGGLVGLQGSLIMTAGVVTALPAGDLLPPGFAIRNGSPDGGV